MRICQQSWHKHGAESNAKSSVPAEGTLCEQLCISCEQSQPSPSLCHLGMAKGIIPETRVGRAGRRSEAVGWCLLRVVGGLRRGGWMWLFPCSAKVQPLLSQRCFSSCIPNRNWGLPLEIGVMEGEGSSPWGKPVSMHGGVQGDPSP